MEEEQDVDNAPEEAIESPLGVEEHVVVPTELQPYLESPDYSEQPLALDDVPNVGNTTEELVLQFLEHIHIAHEHASGAAVDPSIAALVGAGIGAAAALAANFLNNRFQAQREAIAYQEKVAALSGALAGELTAISNAVVDKIEILSQLHAQNGGRDNHLRGLQHRLSLPPSTVFERVAEQLGHLGSTHAKEIARLYALKSTVEGSLKSCQHQISNNALQPHDIEAARRNLENFKAMIDKVELELPR